MTTVKKMFMVIFSLLFGLLILLSFKNYAMYGLIDAFPYAFAAIFCILVASSINESIKRG